MLKRELKSKTPLGWEERKASRKRLLNQKQSHREINKLRTLAQIYGKKSIITEFEDYLE